ncbi:hypothetical protein L7F22_061996 [Adiantum nelumboides]|nr:hypothetical protein [Adiantum nelumboides]
MHRNDDATRSSLEFSKNRSQNDGRPRKHKLPHTGSRPTPSASPFDAVDDEHSNDEHASEGEGVEGADDEALEAKGPVLDDSPEGDNDFIDVVPPEWNSGDGLEQEPHGTFRPLPPFNGIKGPDLGHLPHEFFAGLVNSLERKGHHVSFDRFFTSVNLLEHLLSEGQGGTGTYVANQKYFPHAKMLHLGKKERGAFRFAYCKKQGVLACSWMDKKEILFASNCYGMQKGEVKRLVSGGQRMPVVCPDVAVQYNACKAGCDTFDSMVLGSGYSLQTTMHGFKWWHAGFWGLMDSVFTNYWIIWKELYGKRDVSRFDFMLHMHEQLDMTDASMDADGWLFCWLFATWLGILLASFFVDGVRCGIIATAAGFKLVFDLTLWFQDKFMVVLVMEKFMVMTGDQLWVWQSLFLGLFMAYVFVAILVGDVQLMPSYVYVLFVAYGYDKGPIMLMAATQAVRSILGFGWLVSPNGYGFVLHDSVSPGFCLMRVCNLARKTTRRCIPGNQEREGEGVPGYKKEAMQGSIPGDQEEVEEERNSRSQERTDIQERKGEKGTPEFQEQGAKQGNIPGYQEDVEEAVNPRTQERRTQRFIPGIQEKKGGEGIFGTQKKRAMWGSISGNQEREEEGRIPGTQGREETQSTPGDQDKEEECINAESQGKKTLQRSLPAFPTVRIAAADVGEIHCMQIKFCTVKAIR